MLCYAISVDAHPRQLRFNAYAVCLIERTDWKQGRGKEECKYIV